MRRRVWVGIAAAAALLVLAAAIWHHALARFAVASIVGVTTGYHLDIGEMRLGRNHGALIDAHVSRKGEPVLDAARIDVYYSLRDLLPGSKHRFGLVGITIDRPQVTIIHHQDRTYNITSPGGGAPGHAGRPDTVPLNFTARIRDGQAALIDDYQYYKEARVVRVDGINGDLSVNTAKRTKYTISGAIADVKAEPFKAAGTIDYINGYAFHRLYAAAIPIKTIGNYVINSPAAHILAGTAKNFHATIYALGIAPNVPIAYDLMASADLSNVRLYIHGLNDPLDNIRGRLQIFNGGLAARRLDATVNGIPVKVAGGIFDFSHPQFRLGITGAGDLHELRHVLAFSAKQPVRGRAQVNLLIEGPISQPLLLLGFDANRVYFQKLPFERPRGVVALYAGSVAIVPFKAFYSGFDLRALGQLKLGNPLHTEITLHFAAPSSRVPYVGSILDRQPLAGEALIAGTGSALGVRGYLASVTQPQNVNGFYDVGGNGIGTIGPISLAAAGGTLLGAYSIDRAHGTSAFWASAEGLRVSASTPIALTGVSLPQLPPLTGTIASANLVGTGGSKTLVLGGTIRAVDARVAGVRFRSVGAGFSGPLNDVAMNDVQADGPWGSFHGDGSFAPGRLIARGTYDGTLSDLAQFTGPLGAQGDAHGPVALAIAGGATTVQAQNLTLRGASVHGIPVRSASGTLAFSKGVLRVYSASAQLAGGDLVAAGDYATSLKARALATVPLAIATTTLSGAQLRGLGLPLQGGQVSAVGTVRNSGGKIPAFDGGVVVAGGHAQGYPVAGSAEVALAGDAVTVKNGVGALGSTYAIIDGRVSGLTSGAPAYAVHAQVPAGDVARAAATLHIPAYETQGSFSADLQVGGRGTNPVVQGPLLLPVGSVNGLGFFDANALVSASRAGASAQNGSVQVGATHVNFSASVGKRATAIDVRTARAHLNDFNDFFDTGDTLAGSGYLNLALAQTPRRISTTANLDIDNFRYRSLPIGNTDAHWSSTNNVVRGNVAVGGPHGLLTTSGTVTLNVAPTLSKTVAHSRYDLRGTLANLDLSTWLPALGFPQVPLTGRVNGNASLSGRYPHLGIGGNAEISGGNIGPLPIESANVSARSVGRRIDITHAALRFPALSVTAGGSFGLAPTDAIAFTVQAQTSDPRRLVTEVTKKTLPVSGSFTTNVQIGGTIKAPTFSAGFETVNADLYG
ncbi:MAG: hypothetical protein M3R35_08315, partial [Candidatus Eremiobacteraeota bacterium]|nr:hypothetical protein [Candidatus Eremiobacteraeota bacterium]